MEILAKLLLIITIGFLLQPKHVQAEPAVGRIMRLAPIHYTIESPYTGSDYLFAWHSFFLINSGKKAQTVEAKIISEKYTFTACFVNPTGISGAWNHISDCWYETSIDLKAKRGSTTGLPLTQVIGPGKRKAISLNPRCIPTLRGLEFCEFDTYGSYRHAGIKNTVAGVSDLRYFSQVVCTDIEQATRLTEHCCIVNSTGTNCKHARGVTLPNAPIIAASRASYELVVDLVITENYGSIIGTQKTEMSLGRISRGVRAARIDTAINAGKPF